MVRGRGERATLRQVEVWDRRFVSTKCINIVRRLEIPRKLAKVGNAYHEYHKRSRSLRQIFRSMSSLEFPVKTRYNHRLYATSLAITPASRECEEWLTTACTIIPHSII
jgi:hypothetical protein